MEKEEAKKLALESAIRVTGVLPGNIPDSKSFVDLLESIYQWLIENK